mmetsp:Transcript_22322/g.48837  ORF Transcript_22322/g.48837 Transcript_22322/m.48837 type:complete len:160 (+) Transcript_22322:141-620(+)
MALTLAAPESMIGNSGFVSQGGLGMSCAADALFRQAVPSENVDVWAQDHGLVEAVRTAFEATLRQQPQEPISYLARCLLMLAASKGEVISSAEQELLREGKQEGQGEGGVVGAGPGSGLGTADDKLPPPTLPFPLPLPLPLPAETSQKPSKAEDETAPA